MNERIRDFGKQAYNDATGIWPINSKEWYEVYNTTFAKLIVQECADVCQGFGESGDGYTCSYEILEHFGVEE